jgi:putative membrane protein
VREGWIQVLVVVVALVLSGIGPRDRLTWVLEVFPVAVGLPLAVAAARRCSLTPLLCRLLAIHALILVLGGHYTYAEVPLGAWVQELLGLSRNPYDRLGHVAQGFVPAILVREILLCTSPLRPGRWLFVLVTSACLAFSAFYELIEWWGALLLGESADAFLGTQGDPWDTQWDMFLALVGAVSSQLLLARAHDLALDRRRR